MAVHNLTASDVVVDKAGWQPMDTFPKDGTVVEIKDASRVHVQSTVAQRTCAGRKPAHEAADGVADHMRA